MLSGNPSSIPRNSLKAEGENSLHKAVLRLPDTSYILPPFMCRKSRRTLICDMVSRNMHVSYRIMQQTTANGGGIPKTCQTSHGSRMTSWSPAPRQNGKEVHKRVLAVWRRSANHVRACWPQQAFAASSIFFVQPQKITWKVVWPTASTFIALLCSN